MLAHKTSWPGSRHLSSPHPMHLGGNSSPASMTGVSLHRFYDEIFDKIVDVANKRIDKQQLADWLSSVTIKISSS